MKPLAKYDYGPVTVPNRDKIDSLAESTSEKPPIISLSDIHGYLESARSALKTLTDHPSYEAVVTTGSDGRLHWANNNYVLLFNGDLIDRGPANDEVLQLVSRLASEAPPGRVRVTLGNHEAIALCSDHFTFPQWYSGQADDEDRLVLINAIRQGLVVAAYEGYNVTYAHAGSSTTYTAPTVNESLIEAADDLESAMGTVDRVQSQRAVIETYQQVLGVGSGHLKGPGAGLVWLDFRHLSENAQPQVVGHTRFERPQMKGNVFCQNVIRENLVKTGGEVVFIEFDDGLRSLRREKDGTVTEQQLLAI